MIQRQSFRAEQSRAEQSRAEQSRAEQSRAEQSRAEQLNVSVIGCMDHTKDNTYESANRVYDKNGIAPTLPTMCGGGHQAKIVEVKKMEKQIVRMVQKDNLVLEKDKVSVKIRQATKQGYIECQVPGVADLNYPSSTTRRGRVQDGGATSPTLTTENIPSVIELADDEFWNFMYEIDGEYYLIRIRKLIPLECLRLMGVTDEDAMKILEVNSNTQAYKQAGNSIVVDVLCALFSQLGIDGVERWNDRSDLFGRN